MVRTQIQLTEEQASQLKQLAARRSVSMAELIRRAISKLIAAEEGPEPRLVKSRALGAIGAFRSGLDDLAEQHDEHLEEAFR